MTKEGLKKYKALLILIVLLAVSFAYGDYIGKKSSAPNQGDASVNVIGNEDAPQNVDMSEFWKVWNTLDQNFVQTHPNVGPVTAQDKVYAAIEGMTSAYGDPYTVFMPPAEDQSFSANIAGNFGGVGMELDTKNNTIVVVSALPNTPADTAGIKPGDVLVSIDGTSTATMSVDDAVTAIRGDVGTKVTLGFTRANSGTPYTVSLTRAVINIPSVDTSTKGDIFVISLYNFYAPSDADFRNALQEFVKSGKTKLILDVRGNPGGYLDSAVDMASFFLPLGKTIVTEDFGSSTPSQVYTSKGYDVFNSNLKMLILVDQGTASAAEILSGALQEYGIAKLVGTRTFGKGSVQELLPMSSTTSLKITVARWLTPNGTWISGNGLTPDYPVTLTDADIASGTDAQMNAAVAILDGKNN